MVDVLNVVPDSELKMVETMLCGSVSGQVREARDNGLAVNNAVAQDDSSRYFISLG